MSYSRCEEWAGRNQCRENPDWMLPNCPYSCGSCNQLCLDYNPRCEEWAGRGECDANAAYMSSYCRRSCLQCDELSSPAASASASANAVAVDAVCADAVTIDKCGYWAENGRCTDENRSFKRYMEINCRKTCGFCSLP